MANEIWTIKRCLEWTKEYLAERGEEHPRLSAEWLLCAATGLARIDLYMRMDELLDAAQLETMHAAVVRRAKGEPLQYITGSTQFRMIDVACAPGVLIPRPETEMLVEEVLNYLDAQSRGCGPRRLPPASALSCPGTTRSSRRARPKPHWPTSERQPSAVPKT